MIKVYIIDDHKMVIEGISLLLSDCKEIKITGFALNGESALTDNKLTEADVVLMDVNMPGINGMELTKKLSESHPHIKIIAISTHKEASLIKMMIKNGASGYVVKNAGKDELVEAVRTVFEGKTYFDEHTHEILLNAALGNQTRKENPFPTLSAREKEVLALIMEEYTTQEIAEKLFISFGTVETHRRNMMSKLGVRNTAGLVKTALQYRLLDD